ncbi:heterokaryon incompatibility protein-domain-containing protein, partial [Paraphoma chrysanthemicola]
ESPHSFRLIRILPDPERSQHIHCTIERYERGSEEYPSYTALSYVWGDASEPKPVTLNGKRAFVTTNLHRALWHLRSVYSDVYFWIDALSIDQNNVSERGHQVNQMKAIYGDAKEVVAWLGRGVKPIGPLFEFVEEHEKICTGKLHHTGICKIPEGIGIGDAITYLERNAYWSRVWVIQELVSAAGVSLMCGKHVITWLKIVRFLKRTRRGHFMWGFGEIYRWMEGPNYESYIVTLSNWPQYGITLADALAQSRFSLATDYRDKIYAILGLVNLGAGTNVEADYSLSPCKVICKAIQAIVEDGNKKYRLGAINSMYKFTNELRKKEPRSPGEPECLALAELRQQLRTALGESEASGQEQQKHTIGYRAYCEGVKCSSLEIMWEFAIEFRYYAS